MDQCTIPSTELNNPCDNIKAIYSTQVTTFCRYTLFSLLCQFNYLVLSVKYYSGDSISIS